MRTLFTIYDANANGPAFEDWLTENGINFRKRIVISSTKAVMHYVTDEIDFHSILAVEHWVDEDERRWEITACNKQYVREVFGGGTRYLGSMCEVGADVAMDHNRERIYNWSLFNGDTEQHWIAQFRNPNVLRHFIDDPITRALTGRDDGRWPIDPRCPKPRVTVGC